MLSVFARVRAGAEGAARSVFVCVFCASVHGCVSLPALGVIVPPFFFLSFPWPCQSCALAMRVQFLGHSLFAVYLEKHKSAAA